MKRISKISFIVLASVLMIISCAGTGPQNSEAQGFLKEFDPAEFAKAGLEEYFSGTGSETVKFTPSFLTAKSEITSGTLSVTAEFTDHPYSDYTVTGIFKYELPVSNGQISGYRINSENTATIKDSSSVETGFSIIMGENEFAPAVGTVDVSAETPLISNAEVFPFLPSSNVTFTVVTESGKISIPVSDIQEYEQYTKDMMPEDIFDQYLSSSLVMNAIIADNRDNLQIPGTYPLYGTENTLIVERISETPAVNAIKIEISEPMSFDYATSSAAFHVSTSGTVSINQQTQAVSAENYSASVIISENGTNTHYASKIMNGNYSLSSTGSISGSITIGNHTYNGQEYMELSALSMLNTFINQWGMPDNMGNMWSEPDENGNTFIKLPPELPSEDNEETLPPGYEPGSAFDIFAVYKENETGSSASLSDGSMTILKNYHYPFKADFTLDNGMTENLTALEFNNHVFSQEAVRNLNLCYDFILLF